MGTQKGKCETMEMSYATMLEEFVVLQKEVKVASSLKEEAITHDSPSTLDARVIKLEDSLKQAEKQYQDTSIIVEEKNHQVEEHHKSLRQEIEAHIETLKALQDEVDDLREAICDSLKQGYAGYTHGP